MGLLSLVDGSTFSSRWVYYFNWFLKLNFFIFPIHFKAGERIELGLFFTVGDQLIGSVCRRDGAALQVALAAAAALRPGPGRRPGKRIARPVALPHSAAEEQVALSRQGHADSAAALHSRWRHFATFVLSRPSRVWTYNNPILSSCLSVDFW